MDIWQNKIKSKTKIAAYPCHRGSNQKFDMKGESVASSVNGGLCMDAEKGFKEGAYLNSKPIIVYKCNKRNNQRFKLVPANLPVTVTPPPRQRSVTVTPPPRQRSVTVSSPSIQLPVASTLIKHGQSGKCLDGNGSKLYFLPCQKTNKYQNWTKEKGIDSTNFTLRHSATGKCLDGNGSSLYFGPCQPTNLYQNFSRDGNLLRHKQSGKCLDGNGTSLYFGPCQQTNNYQKWTEA